MGRTVQSKVSVKEGKKSLDSQTFKYFRDPGTILIIVYSLFAYLFAMASIFFPSDAYSAVSEDYTEKINPREAQKGELYLKGRAPGEYKLAVNMDTDVKIGVYGLVAKATVVQNFRNQDDTWVEGIYVFPLPDNAAVTHLRMYIGERIIEGRIQERKQAKKTYEKAKKDGKKASLLEQERPNVFTMSVANIGPKEKIKIELEYQHLVAYDNGIFSLRFPTVVAPRYIPGQPLVLEDTVVDKVNANGWAYDTDEVPDASRITPFVTDPGETLTNPTAISVHLHSGFTVSNIQSLHHSITTEEKKDGSSYITLTNVWDHPNRDFVLQWEPEANLSPQAALFSEKKGDDTYLLMMVIPPHKEKIPKPTAPREVIFVLDVSGSMSGESIEQAKKALKLALSRLKENEFFNIITFNHKTSNLFSTAAKAQPETVQTALHYVDSLRANGGTEMRPALLAALDGKKHPGKIRQVIFLTDGSVGNEADLFQLINNRLGDSRLFTVGIGSAPNSYFMRNAALQGRGTFTYISKVNFVQSQMALLFAKIESPALTDISIDSTNSASSESLPSPIPDLYYGEPLFVVSKTKKLPEKISVEGKFAATVWKSSLTPKAAVDQVGISTLWARTKVKSLMDSIITGADKGEVRESVIKTGMEHHLVTKFTSLVAVDVTPTKPANIEAKTQNMKSNLPKGWKHDKDFGVPQTGTLSDFCIALGCLALVLSFSITLLVQKRRAAA